MAKIDSKKALIGVGVLGVAGLAGAAFAASVTVPDSNAGQGVEVVEGFTVSNIEYNTSDVQTGTSETVTVDLVVFNIDRDGANSGTAVADANAEVYVQLRSGLTGAPTEWTKCVAVNGVATCNTSATTDTINMENIGGISVVAFDNLDAA